MATIKKARTKTPAPHTDQHAAPRQTSQVRSSPGSGYPEENSQQANAPVKIPQSGL
jgi:hypothetical protein